MRPLILAPSKIVMQTTAAEWAEATGGNGVLFTDAQDIEIVRSHARLGFSEIVPFRNFATTGLVERCAIAMHAAVAFTNVLALAETDVMRAARLRERFGLGRLSPSDARLFRDKFEMKLRAANRGVPVTPFALTSDAMDVIVFVEAHGFPVVVKPIDGRGSVGVRVIRNDAALDEYLASREFARRESPLIEKFVNGEMYQVNGLYLNGECKLVSTVHCINSNLDFLDGKYLALVMLEEADPLRARLVEFGRHLLDEALPMPADGLFHIEVFHSDEGQLLLCEVACRLAGCGCNDQIRLAYDVDVRLEYLRSQCLHSGSTFQDAPLVKPSRLIAELNIPPSEGELLVQPSSLTAPGLRLQKFFGVPGHRYGKMEFTNGEIATFLIEAACSFDLVQRVHQVARLHAEGCLWRNALET